MLDDYLTIVLQRWYTPARAFDFSQVDFSHDNARLGAAVGEYFTPGIDYQRMSIGSAFVDMMATLVGRNNVATCFNCPGTNQGVPVCLASGLRKSCWNGDKLCTGLRQGPVQSSKP